MIETIPFRDKYGAHEINGLPAGGQQALLDRLAADGDAEVYWSDPKLARITRLRLLGDRDFPFFDLSYCYGELKDGRMCRVTLPFHQLRKARWKSELLEWAKRDRVYAKGLGLFAPDTVSWVI
jgi:hypothetical protein